MSLAVRGNLPHFSFGSFRFGHKQQPAGKIDILPELVRDLAAAHAGIERRDDNAPEVFRRSAKQLFFFAEAYNLPPDFPLPLHAKAGQRIGRNQILIDGPIKKMAKGAEIPVDRGVLDLLVPHAAPAVLGCQILGDLQDRITLEVRQQNLEVIEMMRPRDATADKPRRDFAEGDIRVHLDDLKAPVIGLLLEPLQNCFRLAPVSGPGGLLAADAIHVKVGPVDIPSFP